MQDTFAASQINKGEDKYKNSNLNLQKKKSFVQ